MTKRERWRQVKIRVQVGTGITSISSQSLLEQGYQHYQEGRLRQAEELYRQALQADPNNPDGFNLLAVVANETGRAVEAIELMAAAYESAGRGAPVTIRRARCGSSGC